MEAQERKKSMKRCKITAVRKTEYKDLMEKYENPIQHACDIEEGQVFITEGWKRPEGFCESAWESISPFVMTLAYGGSDIYEGWMKNKNSAMISCNDGFRPVSFYIEVLDDQIYRRGDMTVLVYSEHPYYDRKEISIEDLKQQKLISLNEKYFIYHSLNQRCQDFGFSPDIVIHTMESSRIYRFCQQKMGIGIDADIHHDPKLLESLHKISIKDAIPWKISLVYKKRKKSSVN